MIKLIAVIEVQDTSSVFEYFHMGGQSHITFHMKHEAQNSFHFEDIFHRKIKIQFHAKDRETLLTFKLQNTKHLSF